MKIADTHSLFIALIWMILFSSCSDENNTPDINGKEIWIGLQIGPSLEYDSQPLSSSGNRNLCSECFLEKGFYLSALCNRTF